VKKYLRENFETEKFETGEKTGENKIDEKRV
jgi:hypothetical protein